MDLFHEWFSPSFIVDSPCNIYAPWMCWCTVYTRKYTNMTTGTFFFVSAKNQQWRTVGIAPRTMGAIVPVFHRRQLFALNNVCSSSLHSGSFPRLLSECSAKDFYPPLRAFDERGDNWFIYLTYRMHHQLLALDHPCERSIMVVPVPLNVERSYISHPSRATSLQGNT